MTFEIEASEYSCKIVVRWSDRNGVCFSEHLVFRHSDPHNKQDLILCRGSDDPSKVGQHLATSHGQDGFRPASDTHPVIDNLCELIAKKLLESPVGLVVRGK